jgi:hypothetical protein
MLTLGIIFLVIPIAIYSIYRIFIYIKWYFLLSDYQKLSDRLDDDIKLLREGKLEEAVLREAKSDKMIYEFKRKYPKEF